MSLLSRTLISAAVAATALLASAPSFAIPAWTRATGSPCVSCHFGASNRLTKMGWDFLARGQRMPAQEGFTEDDLEQTNFLHYASLAARGALSLTENANPSSRFATNAVSLYAGGPLMGKLSFWAAYDFHPEAELGEAYLRYTSDIEGPNYWWARTGQLAPYINWMGVRTTGGPGPAVSGLVGQNNPYRATSDLNGLSAGYNTGTGLRTELGVVNGVSGGAPNNNKDIYGSVMQEFDEQGSAAGLFGYTGKYTYVAGTAPSTTNEEASFNRIGLLGQLLRDNWELYGAYYTGSSDLRTGGDHNPSAFHVGFDYNVRPDHTAYILYNSFDNDLPSGIVTPSTVTGGSAWNLGYGLRYTQWARLTVGLSSTKSERPGGNTTIEALSLGWNFWF